MMAKKIRTGSRHVLTSKSFCQYSHPAHLTAMSIVVNLPKAMLTPACIIMSALPTCLPSVSTSMALSRFHLNSWVINSNKLIREVTSNPRPSKPYRALQLISKRSIMQMPLQMLQKTTVARPRSQQPLSQQLQWLKLLRCKKLTTWSISNRQEKMSLTF